MKAIKFRLRNRNNLRKNFLQLCIRVEPSSPTWIAECKVPTDPTKRAFMEKIFPSVNPDTVNRKMAECSSSVLGLSNLLAQSFEESFAITCSNLFGAENLGSLAVRRN